MNEPPDRDKDSTSSSPHLGPLGRRAAIVNQQVKHRVQSHGKEGGHTGEGIWRRSPQQSRRWDLFLGDLPDHFLYRQFYFWRDFSSRFKSPSFDAEDSQPVWQSVEDTSQSDGFG